MKDLELIGIIKDAGTSAKNLNRPGAHKVLAKVVHREENVRSLGSVMPHPPDFHGRFRSKAILKELSDQLFAVMSLLAYLVVETNYLGVIVRIYTKSTKSG